MGLPVQVHLDLLSSNADLGLIMVGSTLCEVRQAITRVETSTICNPPLPDELRRVDLTTVAKPGYRFLIPLVTEATR